MPEEPFPMFFPANYSCPARKNLPEMHFKTEGTGTAASIRTDKTCGGDGTEDEDKGNKTGRKG